MNDILSGTYKGNTYRIKVECYPNTPAIKVQLLPVNAGERITMTQNLGQPLPRYQAFLCDGMLEVDSTAFMDYMEKNDLGVKDMRKLCTKTGGFVSHAGISDALELTERAKKGDKYAEMLWNTMIYQIEKCIGSMAVVLRRHSSWWWNGSQ